MSHPGQLAGGKQQQLCTCAQSAIDLLLAGQAAQVVCDLWRQVHDGWQLPRAGRRA